MKMSSVILGLVIATATCPAQDAFRRNASINPCPGGKGTTELDSVVARSLDDLIQMSHLIVEGTVVKVLPSVSMNADHPETIETDSLISVSAILYGSLPAGTNTIALFQIGGKTAICEQVVPDDPLVREGERYVLGLWADNRRQPPANTSGAPRYSVAGAWSGRVRMEAGKVHVLPRGADTALRQYDDMDANLFISALKARISLLKKP
jgi:hypothetical protein